MIPHFLLLKQINKFNVMWEKLKVRWAHECSELGLIFKQIVSKFFAVAALAQYAVEQSSLLPQGFVPECVKYILGILAVISFFSGGLTKK